MGADTVDRTRAKAAKLAAQAREAEAVAKAQAKGQKLAAATKEKIADAHLNEKAAELAALAREKIADAHLDERAGELAARMRESDAADTARRVADQGMDRLREWLVTSGTAEKLGLEQRRARRWPLVLAALVGAVLGYAGALVVRSRQSFDEFLPDEGAFDGMDAGVDPQGPLGGTTAGGAAGSSSLSGTTGEQPLAEQVRNRLRDDPRTASLAPLNINVADGTVFIRGVLPAGFDEEDIRAVAASVPGVSDVDVQVTVLS